MVEPHRCRGGGGGGGAHGSCVGPNLARPNHSFGSSQPWRGRRDAECVARRLTATAALACTLLIACSAASASSSALAADAEDLPSLEVGASSDEYPGLTLSLEGTDEDGYPGRFRITVPSGFDLYPE